MRPEVRVDRGGQCGLFLFREVAIDHAGKYLTRNCFAIFFHSIDGHGLDIGAKLHHQHFVGDSPMAEILAFNSCLGNRTAENFWQLLLPRCSCAPVGTRPLLVSEVFLCALARIWALICPSRRMAKSSALPSVMGRLVHVCWSLRWPTRLLQCPGRGPRAECGSWPPGTGEG